MRYVIACAARSSSQRTRTKPLANSLAGTSSTGGLFSVSVTGYADHDCHLPGRRDGRAQPDEPEQLARDQTFAVTMSTIASLCSPHIHAPASTESLWLPVPSGHGRSGYCQRFARSIPSRRPQHLTTPLCQRSAAGFHVQHRRCRQVDIGRKSGQQP